MTISTTGEASLVLETPTWQSICSRRERADEQFHHRKATFLEIYADLYEEEVTYLVKRFANEESLHRVLGPIAEDIKKYLLWLRWSGWLSSYLSPPLNLESTSDARRLAVAVMTYLGARFVDDSIDNHLLFKHKHETLVGMLKGKFPEFSSNLVRSQCSLIGFWVLHYGVSRMRQLQWENCVDKTTRLFEKIAPGVVAETFSKNEASRIEYDAIIHRKSVCYDMIIYQCLLDPVASKLRGPILQAVASASKLAQYLNDYMDREDDWKRWQLNVLRYFKSDREYWEECLHQIEQCLNFVEPLPQPVGDSIACIIFDVFEKAFSLWGMDSNPR